MLKPNLLNDIGFTPEQQRRYEVAYARAGELAESCAYGFMRGGEDWTAVLERLHGQSQLHEYTLDLLFVLSCTGYLFEDYRHRQLPEEVFLWTMQDIKCKADECEKAKQVFGTFVIRWYQRVLQMKIFGLGRLEFEITDKYTAHFDFEKHGVQEGQFMVACHIPSKGPLPQSAVRESYQRAYAFFQDRLTNGILPVFCSSWLLYPGYSRIFAENAPNIANFASDYEVFHIAKAEDFKDAWRVFGVGYEGEPSALPTDTRLQRAFVQHIASGGTFGHGVGVLMLNHQIF